MNRKQLAMAGVAVSALLVGGIGATAVGAPGGNAPVPASQPAPGPTPTIAGSCFYPPQSAPKVTLAASADTIKPSQKVVLDGTVKVNSCGLRQWNVGIYASPAKNGPYSLVDQVVTDATGYFTSRQQLQGSMYFQAVSADGGGLAAGASNVVLVTVKK